MTEGAVGDEDGPAGQGLVHNPVEVKNGNRIGVRLSVVRDKADDQLRVPEVVGGRRLSGGAVAHRADAILLRGREQRTVGIERWNGIDDAQDRCLIGFRQGDGGEVEEVEEVENDIDEFDAAERSVQSGDDAPVGCKRGGAEIGSACVF